jgi:hypothetical protein
MRCNEERGRDGRGDRAKQEIGREGEKRERAESTLGTGQGKRSFKIHISSKAIFSALQLNRSVD